MTQEHQQHENKEFEEKPAAETVIDGQLAGTGLAEQLRQVSFVKVGFVCLLMLALGLSAWPYIVPYVKVKSPDPWQLVVDEQLGQMKAELDAIKTEQGALNDQMTGMMSAIKTLESDVAEMMGSVPETAEGMRQTIDRLDQQLEGFEARLTDVLKNRESGTAPKLVTPTQKPDADQSNDPTMPPRVNEGGDDSDWRLSDLSEGWQGAFSWAGELLSSDQGQDESQQAQTQSEPPAQAQANQTPRDEKSESLAPEVEDDPSWWQKMSGWTSGLISIDKIDKNSESETTSQPLTPTQKQAVDQPKDNSKPSATDAQGDDSNGQLPDLSESWQDMSDWAGGLLDFGQDQEKDQQTQSQSQSEYPAQSQADESSKDEKPNSPTSEARDESSWWQKLSGWTSDLIPAGKIDAEKKQP